MNNENSLSNMSLAQLQEMNAKAKRLVALMKQGIVEFIFKKKSTGELRKAKGTLKRTLIPPEFQRKRGRPKKRSEDLVIYYDVDKQDIRSFKDYLLKTIKKPKDQKSKPDSKIEQSDKKSVKDKQPDKKTDKQNENKDAE